MDATANATATGGLRETDRQADRWCETDGRTGSRTEDSRTGRVRGHQGTAGLPRSLEVQSISLAETLEKGNATSLARNVLCRVWFW